MAAPTAPRISQPFPGFDPSRNRRPSALTNFNPDRPAFERGSTPGTVVANRPIISSRELAERQGTATPVQPTGVVTNPAQQADASQRLTATNQNLGGSGTSSKRRSRSILGSSAIDTAKKTLLGQ